MKTLTHLKIQRILYFLITANILYNYIFLHSIYRPHNVDDAWFLAFAYNYFKFGEIFDSTFNGGTTQGLLFFRKTGALFYGHILNIIGWDYGKAQFISALLMTGSGVFWYLSLGKLNFKQNEKIAFLLLFFYLEFSFAAGTSLRYEALILFFQSMALFLLLKKQYFLVGLVSSIAIETHPIAVLNLAYLIGIAVSSHSDNNNNKTQQNPPKVNFIYFILGCIAGGLYYFYLHPLEVADIFSFLYLNSIQGVGEHYDTKLGILGLYFFSTKYFRHIPELIIILVSLTFFIKNQQHKARPYILIWLSLLLVLSFLRPIFTYAELIFPTFIILIVSSFHYLRKLNLLLIIFACLMIPQYSAVYYLNNDWDRNAYFNEIKSLVPDDGLPVVGSAMSWFALKEKKNFKAGVYPFFSLNRPEWQEAYLIEDHFYQNNNEYRGAKLYFKKNYKTLTLKSSNRTGQPITLKKLIRK